RPWRAALTAAQGPVVARAIMAVLAGGAGRTTSTGETITLAPQSIPTSGSSSANGPAAATTTSPDYPPATWVPADSSNYTVANRTHDYPIDMIVIHDIEG